MIAETFDSVFFILTDFLVAVILVDVVVLKNRCIMNYFPIFFNNVIQTNL